MVEFIFKGTVRNDMGKGASRRLRREGNIPAIVYGAGKEAVSLVLNHNEVLKCFRHSEIYTSIISVEYDGKKESAILRDVQRHPFKPLITHLDFLRVRADEAIVVEIPIELINADKAHGVLHGAGIVLQHLSTVAVSCLPKYLPNVIQLDIESLVMGGSLLVSNLPVIPNIDYVDLMNEAEINDQMVVNIVEPRHSEEATDNASGDSDENAE